MKNLNKSQILHNLKLAIGEELFRQRQQQGLSLKELSKLTNINQDSLDAAETGRGTRLSLLLKLALFYDKDIKIFYE